MSSASARPPVSRRRIVVASLVGVAAVVLNLPAARSQSHQVLREFLPTGKYVVYINGDLDREAEILYSQRAAAILVLESDFGAPFLIQPRTRSVDRLPKEDLLPQEDGSLDLSEDVDLARLGTFQLVAGDVVISFADLKARLKPNPPLLGPHARAEVLRHSPEYARDPFKVDAGLVEKMRGARQDVEVRLFFGSWCPVCQRYMGRVLRIDEALAGSKVSFVYYGLPQPPGAWQEAEFVRNKIERLPTAIVTSGGREIGRLSGFDWDRPEPALAGIVR
jgi:thiol-disulfide isomerase/thioredoxin